jgi:hypothetical protein
MFWSQLNLVSGMTASGKGCLTMQYHVFSKHYIQSRVEKHCAEQSNPDSEFGQYFKRCIAHILSTEYSMLQSQLRPKKKKLRKLSTPSPDAACMIRRRRRKVCTPTPYINFCKYMRTQLIQPSEGLQRMWRSMNAEQKQAHAISTAEKHHHAGNDAENDTEPKSSPRNCFIFPEGYENEESEIEETHPITPQTPQTPQSPHSEDISLFLPHSPC